MSSFRAEIFLILCVFSNEIDLSLRRWQHYHKYSFYKEWYTYKTHYSKKYKDNEEISRISTFASNLRDIVQHNIRYKMGLESFKMAMNKYADMSPDEFVSTFGIYDEDLISYRNKSLNAHKYDSEDHCHHHSKGRHRDYKKQQDIPSHIDWREKGAVTSIKDQGHCASCYAFSAAGVIEAQYYLKTGKLKSLSAQNILDCSWKYGNRGCNGGSAPRAFENLMKKQQIGLLTEEDYKYQGHHSKCRYDKIYYKRHDKSGPIVKDYKLLPVCEKTLKHTVATYGPVSVLLELNSDFLRYSKGVFYSNKPCGGRIRKQGFCYHSMLVVGYGSDPKEGDYWILKNTWGRHWGENGYMKFARNRRNHRDIASVATIAYLK